MEALYIIFIGILLIYGINYYLYTQTEYYICTRTPFLQIFHSRDLGKKGEYCTYKRLEKLGGYKKYLFNCYIPKEEGGTSEIDVLLIHESGIYVFESKNYSGWIFGSDYMQEWTQTIKKESKNGGVIYKNKFYNPIMQNQTHIKHLKHYLSEYGEIPLYSYIIFSERCELKNIKLTSSENTVINRQHILRAVTDLANYKGHILSPQQINDIYFKLYRTSQLSEFEKQEHINNIYS